MIRRILATSVKELLQLKRDWRTALALLAMPIVLLMIYGYALSFDVTDIRLGVVDLSKTSASRLVTEAFLKSGYFVQTAVVDNERPLDHLFDSETGRARALLAKLQESGALEYEDFGSGADPEALERLRSLGYVGGGG